MCERLFCSGVMTRLKELFVIIIAAIFGRWWVWEVIQNVTSGIFESCGMEAERLETTCCSVWIHLRETSCLEYQPGKATYANYNMITNYSIITNYNTITNYNMITKYNTITIYCTIAEMCWMLLMILDELWPYLILYEFIFNW